MNKQLETKLKGKNHQFKGRLKVVQERKYKTLPGHTVTIEHNLKH